jgi:hypothetical protein
LAARTWQAGARCHVAVVGWSDDRRGPAQRLEAWRGRTWPHAKASLRQALRFYFSPLAILKIRFHSQKALFTHEKMEPVHFISLAKGPHLILGVEVVFWVFLTTFLVARF